MKIYKTQKEVEKDIKNGVLAIEDDVKFECNISLDADIIAWDIIAVDIIARNIIAWGINAKNINAWNINAEDIKAKNIYYYALCLAYKSIKCTSIKGKRTPHHRPICLDGTLIVEEENGLKGKEVTVTIDGKTYTAVIK